MSDDRPKEPITEEDLDAMARVESEALPGPWSWQSDGFHRTISLLSNSPWKAPVMDFVRWGLTSALFRLHKRSLADPLEMARADTFFKRDDTGAIIDVTHPDAHFIKAARTMVPRLIAEVRRCWRVMAEQEREIERIHGLLRGGHVSTQMPKVVPFPKKPSGDR